VSYIDGGLVVCADTGCEDYKVTDLAGNELGAG
jgi:hypothetical protein